MHFFVVEHMAMNLFFSWSRGLLDDFIPLTYSAH